jgi:hypothetical protein
VGLFTVNFELGDKTLETLRQIANTVLCLGISRQKGPGRCGDPLMERKTDGISVELRGVDRPPIIMRSGVTCVVFILAGIAFVVGAAVLIGAALAALPFIWGMVVAFAVVVLVAALVAVELRRLWAAATIRAFVSASALDNGQRLSGAVR